MIKIINNDNKTFRFVTAVVSVFVLWLLCAGMVRAEETTVRVGYFELPGFQEFDDLGNPVGYHVDYLRILAEHTGWKYEFIKAESWPEAYKLLNEKKIDLLAPARRTEEREHNFGFSYHPFGEEYGSILTLDTREELTYEDFKQFGDLSFGCVDTLVMRSDFWKYAKTNGFDPKVTYYKDTQELTNALQAGEVDAIVANLMVAKQGMKVLAKFSPDRYYYMLDKDNTELLNQLDEAMSHIKAVHNDLEPKLVEKYYKFYNSVAFTKQEMDLIQKAPVIRIGYTTDRAPISYMDKSTKDAKGITIDILKEISEISGLNFEFVPLPSGHVDYNYLLSHDIHFVSGAEHNSLNLSLSQLMLTNPYLNTEKILVGRETLTDMDGYVKIALATGSQTLERTVKAKYKKAEILQFDTIDECFEAVYNGEADVLLQNKYAVERFLPKPKYEKLVVLPSASMEDELSLAAVLPLKDFSSEEGKLMAILNKSIDSLEEQTVSGIIIEHTVNDPYEFDISDFYYRYRYFVVIVVLCVMLVILVTYFSFRLKAKNMTVLERAKQKLEEEQTRYEFLIEKSNELIFDINLNSREIFVSENFKKEFGWSLPRSLEHMSVNMISSIWRIQEEDLDQFRRSLEEIIINHQDTECRVRIILEDGSFRWCNISHNYMAEDGNNSRIIGKVTDVDEEEREKARLLLKTQLDSLTGLYNKEAFSLLGRQYLAEDQTEQDNRNTAVIFLDLDNFKQVNDVLGHMTGDKAIRDAARKLQVIYSQYDLISRFGGDEFCLMVKEIPYSTLCDKLSFTVRRMKEEYRNAESSVTVTVSIGAAYTSLGHVSLDELMLRADKALYEAKEKGKNRYVICQDDIQ